MREGFDRRCIVLEEVVEEWGEADVPGPGVCDDTGIREALYLRRGIRRWNHDYRRAITFFSRDLGREARFSRPQDQVFGKVADRGGNRRNSNFPDDLQATELRVHCAEAGRA